MSPWEVKVVRAGRLVDVLNQRVLNDQAVIVRGDRIEKVVEADTAPRGPEIIDLSDFTVLPGLMDMHTHLVGRCDTGQGYASLVTRTGAQEALAGVHNAKATVMAGFTTVRDIGTFRAFVDVALRDAIENGDVVGPRMACAGAFVTVSGGGGDVAGFSPDFTAPKELRFGVADSVDEVRRVVREILQRGADFIKIIGTGAVLTEGTIPGAAEFSEAEIRAAVEESSMYGAHVAVHAHGAEGIKRAVRAGAHSIEHGSLMDDEAIELMGEHGTYLVPDIYSGDWIAEEGLRNSWSVSVLRKNEETMDAQREGYAKCVKLGVRIAFGTDSGVYPHGLNARQFAYMVRYGMSPLHAICSATHVSAQLLGWEERVGSIGPGKLADLIAVEGDPTSNVSLLEQVGFVMKAGTVIRAASPRSPEWPADGETDRRESEPLRQELHLPG